MTETVIKSKRVENGRDIYLQEEKTKTDEKWNFFQERQEMITNRNIEEGKRKLGEK